MVSLLKNFVVVLLAMLVGAATVVGYLHYQPASAMAPLVASAEPATAITRAGIVDESTIVSIYKEVSPAVVHITTRGTARRVPLGRIPESPQLPQQPPSQGTGSGVIIDEQGHILTNNHVVDGAESIDVTFPDGETIKARLLGRDPGNDLAMLKIDTDRKLQPAPLGDSSELQAGQLAFAIGNPFGLDGTITLGLISSVGRTYSSGSGNRPIRDMIQTDAAINPGNSGGPLLNSRGEVIGITTAIESPVRGSVGIGFAVPINTARHHLEDLKAGKSISHPWLGISGTVVTSSLAKELEIPAEGVYIIQVTPDSPAQKAGIKGALRTGAVVPSGTTARGGDVILAVDGRKVGKVEEIASYLDSKKPGDSVTITIRREGATQELQATLAEWPGGTLR